MKNEIQNEKYKDLPTIMKVREFREYLHINNEMAYMLVRRKDFPSFKIGSRYYINKDRLPAWLEKQELLKK